VNPVKGLKSMPITGKDLIEILKSTTNPINNKLTRELITFFLFIYIVL
jgi:hypothetical protein